MMQPNSMFFRRKAFIYSISIIMVSCVSIQPAFSQTKLAFVAGIEGYLKDGFEPLTFAEDDAVELKAELDKLGFKTTVLVGQEATLDGLNRGLADLYTSSKELKRDDIVLIFFSGHGIQKLVRRKVDGKVIEKEEPFFCPIGAHKNDISTMLNLNDVLQRLQDDSACGNNIVLLDACRESLDKGKGIDGSTIEALPNKIALFFAAQSGHRSFESSKLRHGIFSYYLLEGLRGRAADADNEITLQGLTSYVSKRVQRDSPALLDMNDSEAQQPQLMGNLRGALLLGKLPTNPGGSMNNTTKTPTPTESLGNAKSNVVLLDEDFSSAKLGVLPGGWTTSDLKTLSVQQNAKGKRGLELTRGSQRVSIPLVRPASGDFHFTCVYELGGYVNRDHRMDIDFRRTNQSRVCQINVTDQYPNYFVTVDRVQKRVDPDANRKSSSFEIEVKRVGAVFSVHFNGESVHAQAISADPIASIEISLSREQSAGSDRNPIVYSLYFEDTSNTKK